MSQLIFIQAHLSSFLLICFIFIACLEAQQNQGNPVLDVSSTLAIGLAGNTENQTNLLTNVSMTRKMYPHLPIIYVFAVIFDLEICQIFFLHILVEPLTFHSLPPWETQWAPLAAAALAPSSC